MKVGLSFFIIFLYLPLFGQSQIEGVVIDEKNKQPIVQAHIVVKNKLLGTLSDQKGYFNLAGLQENDSLKITCVGYESQSVSLSHKPIMEIKLKPRSYKLSEVQMESGNPIYKNYGFQVKDLDFKRIGSISYGVSNIKFSPSSEFGLFINNEENRTGLIQSISYYLHDQGKSETPFRVRIYAVDENGQAAEEILQENIVVKGETGKYWIEVDLKGYQIEFPPHGFLVMMEWLMTGDIAYQYEVKWKHLMTKQRKQQATKKAYNKKLKGYGQILGSYQMEEMQQIWTTLNGKWSVFDSYNQPMIRVVIKEWH